MNKQISPFYINPVSSDGLRWIENVSKGWRLIGYADELNRSIQHTGWFTDEDGMGETLRGIVYKLPSRKGSPVYAVGYADPYNDDCARLEIVTHCDDDSEAASYADSIAERAAETEREYQSAWQLGREYADASETIVANRETRKTLFAELRTVTLPPTICETIREKIKSTRRNIREALDTQRRITSDYVMRGDLLSAFADGADMTLDEAKVLR